MDKTPKAKINDKAMNDFAEAVSRLGSTIDETPTIAIVGAVGNGKTTTVKQLFNKNSAQVIHPFRITDNETGTKEDEARELELAGSKIRLIDLPGLGDSPKKDEQYKGAYRRRLKEAHAVVFVVVPPRPAAAGTCATLDLILQCGFPPDAIVFGINKLSELRDCNDAPIAIDPADGPVNPAHRDRVERARIEFLNQINDHAERELFVERQVVAYDAKNGWNSFKLIEEAVRNVPWRALRRWREATSEAEERQEALAKDNEALKASLEEYKRGVTYRLMTGMANACRDNGWDGLAESIDSIKERVSRTTHAVVTAVRSVWDLLFG